MATSDGMRDYRDLLFDIRSKITTSRLIAMLLIVLLIVFDYIISVTRSFWETRIFSELMVLYLAILIMLLLNLLQLSSRKTMFHILLIGHRALSFQSVRSWNSRLYFVARVLLSFFAGFVILLAILVGSLEFGLENRQNILLFAWIFSLLLFAIVVVTTRVIRWLSGERDKPTSSSDKPRKKSFKDLLIPFLTSLVAYVMRYFLDSLIEAIIPSVAKLREEVSFSSSLILFLTSTMTFLTIMTFVWGVQTLIVILKERRWQQRSMSHPQGYVRRILGRKWGNSWLVGGASFVASAFLIFMAALDNSANSSIPPISEFGSWIFSVVIPNVFVPSMIPYSAFEMLAVSSLVSLVLALLLISLRPSHAVSDLQGVNFSRLLNLTCLGGTFYTLILLHGYSISFISSLLLPFNSVISVVGISFALFMAFSPYFYSLVHVNQETASILRRHYARDLLRFKERYKGIFFDKESLLKSLLFQLMVVMLLALLVIPEANFSLLYGLFSFLITNLQEPRFGLENLVNIYVSGPFVFLRILLHGYMLMILFFMRFEVPMKEVP